MYKTKPNHTIIKIKMESKQTQLSKKELIDICKELKICINEKEVKICVNESKCHEDHIELYIQKAPNHKCKFLRGFEEKILIDTKDLSIDTIKEKLIKFSNDCDIEFQSIINTNLPLIIPISCSELYQTLKDVYQRIKKDDIISLPCSIEDDDKDRCVYFNWGNGLSIYFEFEDNNIQVGSDEFNDEEPEETYVYVEPPEFEINEIDLLIDFLRDCFTYGKILHPKEYYTKKLSEIDK
jgi:hypothetical protein